MWYLRMEDRLLSCIQWCLFFSTLYYIYGQCTLSAITRFGISTEIRLLGSNPEAFSSILGINDFCLLSPWPSARVQLDWFDLEMKGD